MSKELFVIQELERSKSSLGLSHMHPVYLGAASFWVLKGRRQEWQHLKWSAGVFCRSLEAHAPNSRNTFVKRAV